MNTFEIPSEFNASPAFEPTWISNWDIGKMNIKETPYDRKLRMIRQLSLTCLSCSMCELGLKDAEKDLISRDPHVLSNLNPKRFILVGQNPGFTELEQRMPFVGASGKNFDAEITRHGISRDEFYITNIVKCLRYNARVKLADGSTKPISHLVRDKYSGLVQTLDGDRITFKRVIGWYKTPVAGRRLFKVSYQGARSPGGKKGGTVMTGDHPLLTRHGWVRADSVRNKHIATAELAPNKVLSDIIYGTMLGDAFITGGINNIPLANIGMGHGPYQKDYIKYKHTLLQPMRPKSLKPASNGGLRFTTEASRYWKNLRTKFYKDGKKIFKFNKLSNIGIAFWYMDDGYITKRGAIFCTDDLDLDSISRLRQILSDKGLKNSLFYHHKIYPRIRIHTNHTHRLFKLIAKYIHPSMRYKLHKKYQNVEFIDLSDVVSTSIYWVKPIIRSVKKPDASMYCINVEDTHNFILSDNLIVHNCFTKDNAKPSKDHVQKCKPFLLMEINLIKPLLVVSLGAVAFSALCPDLNYAENLGSIVESKEYNTKVMAIYHPSPLNMTDKGRKAAYEKQVAILCALVKKLRDQ